MTGEEVGMRLGGGRLNGIAGNILKGKSKRAKGFESLVRGKGLEEGKEV